MSEIENTKNVIETGVVSFLSEKPIWFWWLTFSFITGLLFGLFYFVVYVLTLKWWVVTILILLVGVIWGTIGFVNKKKAPKPKPES